MSKIIVIGANHAGTAALNTMLDNYNDNEIIAFDGNNNISFLGCGMALWIGKQISGPEGLFYSTKEKLEEKGAKIYMETPVKYIDFDKKIVCAIHKDGQEIKENYDKLILATGSIPIVPNIEGKELENVQMVKLYQNAQEVIDKLQDESIKDVIVVGAGYIGVELAEAFKRWGKTVTLIDCVDTCLAGYYDEEFTQGMKENLEKNGVKLAFGETLQRIEGKTRVEQVVTDKGVYKADMVVMAVGFRPNNNLGEDRIKLFKNGAYIVDKHQLTNMKDVYAIGDCATVYDNSINDVNYIALASNAVRSGIVAGHNACGKELESVGVQGSNGISIWGYNMLSTGMTLSKAKKLGIKAGAADYEDTQKPGFMENNSKVKIRIVYDLDSRVVLGTQIASDYDISMGLHMFSLAIQEKVTIDKLRLLDLFFLPHFNQPYSYITLAAQNAK